MEPTPMMNYGSNYGVQTWSSPGFFTSPETNHVINPSINTMANCSLPMSFYTTHVECLPSSEVQLPKGFSVPNSRQTTMRPILGRPPVSLPPAPTDDEITKSSLYTQLICNWDQLNQENIDAGAFYNIEVSNGIISTSGSCPNETTNGITLRNMYDLQNNMAPYFYMYPPIVCDYEYQKYQPSLPTLGEDIKSPASINLQQYSPDRSYQNVQRPVSPDDDLLSQLEKFHNQDTEQMASKPALLGQLNLWPHRVSNTFLPRHSGSSLSEMSLPRHSGSWSLLDDDLSRDPLLPDVSPVDEIFDEVFPDLEIDYRILDLPENKIFTPLKFDNPDLPQPFNKDVAEFPSYQIFPAGGEVQLPNEEITNTEATPTSRQYDENKQQKSAAHTSDASFDVQQNSEECSDQTDAEINKPVKDVQCSDEAKASESLDPNQSQVGIITEEIKSTDDRLGENVDEKNLNGEKVEISEQTVEEKKDQSHVEAVPAVATVEVQKSTTESAKPSGTNPALKKYCGFCQKKGKTVEQYTSHNVKDGNGRVTCPVLKSVICPLCGATGTWAHTRSYCVERRPGYNCVPRQSWGYNARYSGRVYY